MEGAGTTSAGAGRVIEDGAILIEKDVIVPLIDGHYVSCNVFRPNRTGRFPPIIAFTPYGKDSDVAVDFKRYWDFVLRDHPDVVLGKSSGKYLTWEVPDPERWIADGYAIVVADARGTGKSPGYYELMSAKDLAATFSRIVDELHHQYALGFAPTVLDGKLHTIDVHVTQAGAMVRARRSYLARSER